MAGKIRGITIELSADASGVLDAVKDINKQIKSTSSQLKDVDRLLKLDPTNMTLLGQKTEQLQKQIQNTKTKLDTLKQAQADMDANGVDKNSEQYQALQREIIATEQELKKLESTAGSGSAALAKISAVTGDIGDKMEAVGKKMSIVSGAIVAFGTAAVAAFNEVDEGADIVIKKTGATGESAEELEDVYKEVASNIVADFTEIGNAVGEVSTRFSLSGEELEDLSEEFLKFADINSMDVTSAVAGVDHALKTFNLSQDQAVNVMGLLSKTSQDTGISMDTLLSLLQSSGPALKEMGLDLDDAVTLMGNFEAAGLDSSDMLARLKKAAAYYNEQGLDMNEGLNDLISRLQDSTTEAEATAEAYEIFGQRGGLAFITAAKEGKLSLEDLGAAMEDYSGVVDETYEATLDGTDKMALAWQNVKIGMSELGEAVGNTLAPIMDKLTGVIQKVTKWFSNLDDGTKNTVVTIAAIVAAIGPLLVVGGKVMKGISSITGALSKVGTSAAGPIGLVITAVAALVAGLAALTEGFSAAYKETSPFTESLEDLKDRNEDLAESISGTKTAYEDSVEASESSAFAAETLYGKLQSLITAYDGTAESSAMIEQIVGELNELIPGLGLAWDGVTGSLNLTNEEIYANIDAMKAQAKVAALQKLYTESLQEQYTAQKNVEDATRTANEVLEAHGVTWQDLNEAMADGQITEREVRNLLLEQGEAYDVASGGAEELIDSVNALIEAKGNQIEVDETVAYAEEELGIAMTVAAETATSAADSIRSQYQRIFGTEIPAELDAAIVSAQNAGIQIPQSLVTGLANGDIALTSAVDRMNALVNFDGAMKRAGLGGFEVSQEFVNNWLSGAYSWEEANSYLNSLVEFSQAINEASQSGVKLTEEFVNGLLNDAGLGGVISAAEIISESAKPSIVIDEVNEVGASVPQGISDGMASNEGVVTNTASQMADDIVSEFSGLPGEMNSSGSDSGSNLNSGFGGWRSTISGTVDNTYDFFYNTLGTTLPAMMSTWGSNAAQKYNSGLNIWSSDISATAQSMSDAVTNAVQHLPSQMQSVGSMAGSGLYSGLSSWQGALSSLAWSIANSINSAARAALQIKSPSRVLEEVGEYSGEGIEIGLENSARNIYRTAEDIAGNVATALTPTVGINAMNGTAAVESQQNNSGMFNSVIQIMQRYLPHLAEDKQILFDDGTWAGRLAPAINQQFEAINKRSARG